MRDVKFRAWDKKYKKYITVFTIDANGYFMSQSWTNDNKDIRTRHILEQYTGLKDEHGVDIYEGDILSFFNPDNKTTEILVVEFNDCSFVAENEENYENLNTYNRIGYIEVIGNIHESEVK